MVRWAFWATVPGDVKDLKKLLRKADDELDVARTIIRDMEEKAAALRADYAELERANRRLEETIGLRELAVDSMMKILDALNEQREAEAAISSMKIQVAKSPGRGIHAQQLVRE